jgi:hypothetical protein
MHTRLVDAFPDVWSGRASLVCRRTPSERLPRFPPVGTVRNGVGTSVASFATVRHCADLVGFVGIGSVLRFFVSSITMLDLRVETCFVEVSEAIKALRVVKSLVCTFNRKSISPVVMRHSRISGLRLTNSWEACAVSTCGIKPTAT